MKRLLMFVIACLISVNCFAQSGDTHSQVIYTYVVTNSATTNLTTNVGTDVIRPKTDKIIGLEVISQGAPFAIASLWDNTANTPKSSDELMTETEATSSISGSVFFPFPRYILTQVTLQQTGNSIAVIYYIRN